MPTFEIVGHDGTYQLTAPDERAALSAFATFTGGGKGAPLAPKAQEGSSLTGVAKSLGTGLAEGAIGLAGLPGDVGQLASNIGNKLPDAPSPSSDSYFGRFIQFMKDESAKSANLPAARVGSGDLPGSYIPPTSDQLQKSVEGVTGDFYKPQGAAEHLANKIGQFAPAVIGGPESLAAKALTRVAAPAVASDAAGKLAEGTAAQPYAELGGALLGAGGATAGMRKFQELVAARNAARLIPTSDDIKAASRGLYQHPDVAAVQIHPAAASDLADTISRDLQHGQNSGFRPANEPKVFNAVDELNTAAKENRPATIADIDSVRQVLGGLAREKDAIGQPTRQAAAASRAIDQVNDFLPNLKQPDLLAGDATKANSILEQARANWAAFKKSSQVQNLASNAELNAASSHSGANIQNATKQAFKPLLKNDGAKVASWTDDERAALNSIVRGSWTGNAARAAGNVLGGGGGLGMLLGAGAGYEGGGIPGAIAGAAAGRAFKMIGNRSTLNAVDHLDTLIRSRSPEAMRIAAQNPQIVQALPPKSIQMLRAIIAFDPTLRALNQPSGAIGQPNAQ
ncbi:hypothetical protein [Bradyrhizobium canariense]|uniref:Uncharacterized protein n=1 Tax=Bradyrhizobium canariense TaxID=255045 RepID=A0A1X3GFC5_9BRAD|nr:hypothetical protein [Bradyrhizobium canariense]OSI66349.1 hypothetical protein BSZ22_27910 [Bradyrhizobium canariense]OSI77737.1 hypothetical protein BSZ23_20700 [Bradyrhizobium canariense]OSI86708.1 hypothetical protein BSZ24_28590 [Bradyrhizobium canariense]OSI88895.1 hypothetical protein BSZ25_22170 [Bradyrhizobium canariense]OSJ01349.1 hypothetical protein BSZ16_19590 [Bradyrhizobium canariense]